MEIPVQKQIQISQDSWLLRRLYYSQLLSDIRPQVDNPTLLSAVNAVALYLTTGKPDGVLATFYMHSTSTLFLSKSGAWGPEDSTAVASFMDCLNDATKFDDLVAFLAKRSATKVNRRIRKLARVFVGRLNWLEEQARSWPHYEFLMNGVQEVAKYFNDGPFVFDNNPETRIKFVKLAEAAQALLSPTFSYLYRNPNGEREEYSELVLHRLEKVAQYLGGKALLRFWKKHGDAIRVVWIPGTAPLPQIQLETMSNADHHIDPLIAGRQLLDDEEKRELRIDLDGRLYYYYHDITLGIKTPATIPMTVRLHPELQLLLWITVNVLDLDALPNEQLYIGCSMATCLCCGLWINAFNMNMKMNWTTRLGNGQPRSDWAIPSPTGELQLNPALVSALNFASKEVERGVDDRVKEVLTKKIDEELDIWYAR